MALMYLTRRVLCHAGHPVETDLKERRNIVPFFRDASPGFAPPRGLFLVVAALVELVAQAGEPGERLDGLVGQRGDAGVGKDRVAQFGARRAREGGRASASASAITSARSSTCGSASMLSSSGISTSPAPGCGGSAR